MKHVQRCAPAFAPMSKQFAVGAGGGLLGAVVMSGYLGNDFMGGLITPLGHYCALLIFATIALGS